MSKTVVSKAVMLGLAVLAFAPSASALPEGFRLSARLTPRAQVISGGVGQVACPTNWTAWLALQRERGVEEGSFVDGITTRSEMTAYLSPDVCVTLEGWLRGKAPRDMRALAEFMETFVHEAIHLRGFINERDTECAALSEFRLRARTLFGVKNKARLRALHGYAIAANKRLPESYHC